MTSKTTDLTLGNAAPEATKITFYVTYEGDHNTRFDHDYYTNVHCPFVREAWEAYGLERAHVYFPADKTDGTILIWAGLFKDRSALDAAFKAPLTPKVMEDIKNFTDVTPKRSIAESF